MTTYQLYNDTVTLNFEENPYHRYSVNDAKVDSVTTILGAVLAKPALIQWAANEAAKAIDAWFSPGIAYDEIHIQDAKKFCAKAHTVKRDKSADIGSLVHEWCERHVKGLDPDMPVNPEMLACVTAFLQWEKEMNPMYLESEVKIYSQEENYAGTFDCLARINGKNVMIDFKTGSGIYPYEMGMQLSAYKHAYEEEYPNFNIHQGLIVNIQKTGKLETRFFDELEKDFSDGFAPCLVLYRRQQELKNNK